jgi:hypothetical protein
MNLIYSISSLLAKILIEEREKNTMPPDLAVSKNIVMPILFQVEGSTKMFGVVILVYTFGQILLLRNMLCNC